MGIEGIYIGYGIETNYLDLAKMLKIKAKKSKDKIIKQIEEHLESSDLSILFKSHDTEESGDSVPNNIYFGYYVKIGGYECWDDTRINAAKVTKLQELFSETNPMILEKKAKWMTITIGCSCCS